MKIREFKPTSWAIDNRTSVYILTIIITLLGLVSYINLPKEQFPDIVIPTISIGTLYPGTSPADIENLVTRPIEKQLKAIAGVKKITSTSVQDFSSIVVEFLPDILPAVAKQRVSDAVDKSKNDLPNDMPNDPNVLEIDFSEFPIMAVNISGDFELNTLKKYAEDIQDRIETLKEITRVDIIGAPDREIQINADVFKMEAAGIAFGDIQNAVSRENVNVSGGEVNLNNTERTLRVTGEFRSMDDIRNIIVKGSAGNAVYIKDIADVEDSYADRKSYARLDGKPVLILSVIKKSGANLINASDKIFAMIDEMKAGHLPQSLKVTITNDQSHSTRTNLSDLINSVIIGFALVTLVMMFFMGTQNAIFVGLSVPLSVALSFMLMPILGYSFNIIVTFGYLLALGIIVDDAIVVIENTHRMHHKEHLEIIPAAKLAAGEVLTPVVAGTLTTLAPFFPLLFWPGIVGKFMIYLPVVLIISLTASLIVAFIINPVFAVQFMERNEQKTGSKRGFLVTCIILASLALISYAGGSLGFGNLFALFIVFVVFNRFVLTPILIKGFQEKVLPGFMGFYRSVLRLAIRSWHPYAVLGIVFGLIVLTIVLMAVMTPKVEFFPDSEPSFVYVYLEMPVGTDAQTTDSLTRIIEGKVNRVISDHRALVKSVISNVGIGAGDPNNPDRTVTPHKGKVTVAFVDFEERHGVSTRTILQKIRENITDIPGAEVTVDKNRGGPPTGKPVNIEISGDDLDSLMAIETRLKHTIVDFLHIEGIEELRSSLERSKPEVLVNVNRVRANQEGITTGQIGMAVRTALYGFETSKYRDGEDEYPIQLRLKKEYRNDVNALLNLKISYREMSSGQFRQVPISSVADISYSNTFGGITRKGLKRIITLSSNVITGYNANQINQQIRKAVSEMNIPEGYAVDLTGEQEDQKETGNFLVMAFGMAIALIFLILVTQFNSTIKPIIILATVFFGVIGVLLGFTIFHLTISIVMTGVGIVSLAGIVVKNGILLLDFTDLLKARGYRTRTAIVEGGAIRFTPVLLTAVSVILGLIPLAIGFNINFATLFSEMNPHIFFGGDSVAFWAPLSWAVIIGVSFSFFLTLVVVPSMYFIQYVVKLRFRRSAHHRRVRAMHNATLRS